ncbi:HAD-IA family hydrolase [Roseivirga misakiensis]|uniref:Haloacid dehalogenase n=1 Tax=Roseivirga misakiensis TaxID=1563681 RepID=A0A1E5SL93_9BACT|nr:HAD-IA family hydrolase [Roseivirga misakiensis]OEJ99898.1 haloacid dehalogenase [Roseivirga misakiensis]
MIKCLIFDCDGTLVDSEMLCNLGLEIKLRDYGIETSARAMMEKYRGGKLANILKDIEEKHDISFNENFVPEYRALVNQLFEKELKPCHGVHEFLSQNKLSVCVASSGPVQKINTALTITGLKRYFGNNVYSSYDINSWKPEPEIFLYAAEKMGFSPNECLIIEDSLKGLEAGLAAKIKTVLYDPSNSHEGSGVIRIDTMIDLGKVISAYNNTI